MGLGSVQLKKKGWGGSKAEEEPLVLTLRRDPFSFQMLLTHSCFFHITTHLTIFAATLGEKRKEEKKYCAQEIKTTSGLGGGGFYISSPGGHIVKLG